jgi:hypothetical protein
VFLLFLQNSGVDRHHPAALPPNFPTDHVPQFTVIAAFRLKKVTLGQGSLEKIRFLFSADDFLKSIIFD